MEPQEEVATGDQGTPGVPRSADEPMAPDGPIARSVVSAKGEE
jgi:hypothetical protein